MVSCAVVEALNSRCPLDRTQGYDDRKEQGYEDRRTRRQEDAKTGGREKTSPRTACQAISRTATHMYAVSVLGPPRGLLQEGIRIPATSPEVGVK